MPGTTPPSSLGGWTSTGRRVSRVRTPTWATTSSRSRRCTAQVAHGEEAELACSTYEAQSISSTAIKTHYAGQDLQKTDQRSDQKSEAYSSGAWTAKQGEDDAFVEAWTEFARWLITMPGAGTARLTRNLSEPRRYLSFAPWETAEAMHTWKSNPEFGQRLAAVRELIAELTPSEFELVAEVEGGLRHAVTSPGRGRRPSRRPAKV
jgi:heme-degrading monooxygenase HmoA